MPHVPDLNTYFKESTISRYTILTQMLEHKNPAFVFSCILDKLKLDKFYESLNTLNEFGFIFDAIYEQDGEDDKYGGKGKMSNSSGEDSLKKLIGKIGKDSNLTDKEWQEVGRQIAGMDGYNKRDYVGMMNFLNTSCYMHSFIANKIGRGLRDATRRKYNVTHEPGKRGRKPKIKPEPEVKPETQEENTQEQPQTQPEAQQSQEESQEDRELVNDSLIYDFSTFTRINENIEKMDNALELEFNDIITLMAYSLSQLTDLQIEDISDEINDYDEEFYKGKDGKIHLPHMELYDGYGNLVTEKWDTPQNKKEIRMTRGNGKGGLKQLVGKGPGDDLEESDLSRIASEIKGMDPEVRGRYMGYVSFLGSSCPIFSNIRKGYLSTLKDKSSSRFSTRQRRHNYSKK